MNGSDMPERRWTQEDATVLADIRSRAADRLERLEAEEAKTKQLRAGLAALHKGLQDEIEALREIRSETEWGDDFEAEVAAHADRLAALLDSSGGK